MRSTIPRIPHLPGSRIGSGDLSLSEEEARPFFGRRAVVSEKLDGISLNIRRSASGALAAGLKADWLRALSGRVRRAANLWVAIHEDRLGPILRRSEELYGEWLWHRLAIRYDALPSAAIFYGLRDRRGRLAPRGEVAAILRQSGLPSLPSLFEGVIGDRALGSLVTRSAFGPSKAEGLVVEIELHGSIHWAKWVRATYRQPAPDELGGSKNRVRSADDR